MSESVRDGEGSAGIDVVARTRDILLSRQRHERSARAAEDAMFDRISSSSARTAGLGAASMSAAGLGRDGRRDAPEAPPPHSRESLAVEATGDPAVTDRMLAAVGRMSAAEAAARGLDPTTIDRARFLRADVAMQRQARLVAEDRPARGMTGEAERGSRRRVDAGFDKSFGTDRARHLIDVMEGLPTSDLETLSKGGSPSPASDRLLAATAHELREPNREVDAETARLMGVERRWSILDLASGRSKADVAEMAPQVERERMVAREGRMGLRDEFGIPREVGNGLAAQARRSVAKGPTVFEEADRGPRPERSQMAHLQATYEPTRSKGPGIPHVQATYDARSADRGR